MNNISISKLNNFYKALDKAVEKHNGNALDEEKEGIEVLNSEPLMDSINAIKEYGQFLALIDENDYEKITYKLVSLLIDYRNAIDKENCLFNVTNNKTIEKIKKDLEIAKKFYKTLKLQKLKDVNPYSENQEPIKDKVFLLKNIIGGYIKELEDLLKNKINTNGYFLFTRYEEPPKKSKEPIRQYLKEIVEQYQLNVTARAIKKLVDSL